MGPWDSLRPGSQQAWPAAREESRVDGWATSEPTRKTVLKNFAPAERKKMAKKLYIYDVTSYQDRWQAAGRFRFYDTDIITLPAKDVPDVMDGLKRFLSKGMVFDRMLVQTHGDSGKIFLGD